MDLTFVETDVLLVEIEKRFDVLLFTGVKTKGQGQATKFKYKGGILLQMGLHRALGVMIDNKYRQITYDIPPDKVGDM